jgi:hypothetical protein
VEIHGEIREEKSQSLEYRQTGRNGPGAASSVAIAHALKKIRQSLRRYVKITAPLAAILDDSHTNNLHKIKYLRERVQMVSHVLHLSLQKEKSIPAGGAAKRLDGGKGQNNDTQSLGICSECSSFGDARRYGMCD